MRELLVPSDVSLVWTLVVYLSAIPSFIYASAIATRRGDGHGGVLALALAFLAAVPMFVVAAIAGTVAGTAIPLPPVVRHVTGGLLTLYASMVLMALGAAVATKLRAKWLTGMAFAATALAQIVLALSVVQLGTAEPRSWSGMASLVAILVLFVCLVPVIFGLIRGKRRPTAAA